MDQEAIVELEPFFIVDSNDFIFDITTGNSKIDKLVKDRLKRDHTNVKTIIWDPFKVTLYSYDPKRNIITLKVKKNKGKWSMDDAKTINENYIDPYNIGPDTWMEGNIVILNKNEVKGTKYAKEDGIELGVIARKIEVPAKVKEVSSKLNRKVKGGEKIDISPMYNYEKNDGYITIKESKSKTKPNNDVYITNGEDLDAFAKSIGWFDKETSEYTGVGNYKTRKAPSSQAKNFDIGTERKGLDGNDWVITQTKNGTKRWMRKS